MIVALSKKSTTLLATGNLIREGRKYPFRYDTVAPRSYMADNGDTVVRLKATASIKLNVELKLVYGDRILLDGETEPLRVVRISPSRPKKGQYMYLKKPIDVEYIVDLE